MRSLMAGGLLALTAAAPATDWNARALDLYRHAVETPTVAGRGQVPGLAAYFAEQLKAGGFPAADMHILPYEGEAGDKTAALIVRWAADRPARKPILLLAHMDVVEAKRADWTTDPFQLVTKDGYYYGRGSWDDKQGAVALVTAFLRLRAEGFKPKRDLILLLTGDEETANHGAELGATAWRKWTDAEFGLNADAGDGYVAADGKPLGFHLQSAEKIYADYTLTVTNKGGHSSKPRADNAIYGLAHALTRIEAYRFVPELNETTRAYFEARQTMEKGPLGDAMRAWLKNPADGRAADTIEANALEVGFTRTRCVATRLAGGHADNALPQLATANINCRIMPGTAPTAIRDLLQRVVADPQVTVTLKDQDKAAGASPLRADVVQAFTAAVHKRHPDQPIVPEMSTGATDGAPFRAVGIPVYGVNGTWVVSPEDERAHGRDERLPIRSFEDNLGHWTDMLTALAG